MSDPESIEQLASDLRLACQQVSRRVRFEGSHEAAPHQFSVLVKVLGGPRTPGELADAELVSKPSMSRTIRGLETAGWVRIDDHPGDGRQKLVTLTEAGRQVIERTRADRDSWMMRYLETLSVEQRALLRASADLLAEMMRR